MSEIMHADIFFLISAIAVVLCTAAFLVIAWYVIQILRDVQHVADKARDASDTLESGFKELIESFLNLFRPKRKRRAKSEKPDMVE